jgi:hypothetical protein
MFKLNLNSKKSAWLCLFFVVSLIVSSCSTTKRIKNYCDSREFDKLEKYTDSEDYRERNAILEGLRQYDNPEVIPYLLETAENSTGKVFARALDVLDSYHRKEIKEFLFNELDSSSSSIQRKIIILEHISKYVSKDNIHHIKRYLKSDNSELQLQAAEVLVKKGDKSGEGIVADYLHSDFFIIQRKAARIIGYYENREYVPVLKSLLNESDPVLKENVKFSLKKILGNDYQQVLKKYATRADKKEIEEEPKKQLASQTKKEQGKHKGQDKTDKKSTGQKPRFFSSVDKDIPENNIRQSNTYALIIGNQDYSSYQTNLQSESNVDFARHDAKVFKKYMVKTLGVPEDNILFKTDAKYIEMERAVNKLSLLSKNSEEPLKLIFYYAGHGFPDEKTHEPYLIPVDVSGSELEYALKLKDIYKKLTRYPCERVTVFLDACFSGGARSQGLIASRGVKIKPRESHLNGKVVVFSASSGKQSALPYNSKSHGIFTYYLLKKINETKGRVTYSELADYVESRVSMRSILVNNKEQKPHVNVGLPAKDNWKEWKLIE